MLCVCVFLYWGRAHGCVWLLLATGSLHHSELSARCSIPNVCFLVFSHILNPRLLPSSVSAASNCSPFFFSPSSRTLYLSLSLLISSFSLKLLSQSKQAFIWVSVTVYAKYPAFILGVAWLTVRQVANWKHICTGWCVCVCVCVCYICTCAFMCVCIYLRLSYICSFMFTAHVLPETTLSDLWECGMSNIVDVLLLFFPGGNIISYFYVWSLRWHSPLSALRRRAFTQSCLHFSAHDRLRPRRQENDRLCNLLCSFKCCNLGEIYLFWRCLRKHRLYWGTEEQGGIVSTLLSVIS